MPLGADLALLVSAVCGNPSGSVSLRIGVGSAGLEGRFVPCQGRCLKCQEKCDHNWGVPVHGYEVCLLLRGYYGLNRSTRDPCSSTMRCFFPVLLARD